MKEHQLHYLFSSRKLGGSFITTSGYKLEILDFGDWNKNSGPDFLNAKVLIDGQAWAGPIEFHLRSSDWYRHNHHEDPAYSNVIAHFVMQHDLEVFSGLYTLPTIELRALIEEKGLDQPSRFNQYSIERTCQKSLGFVESNIVQTQLNHALDHRLLRKSKEITELLRLNLGDQQKTLFLLIAKALGGKVNQEAFIALVDKIDISMFGQLNFDPKRTDALMHGISGLLPNRSDKPYVQDLIQEFTYLKKMFHLEPMPSVIWKKSSFRPGSSPSFRIAQLSAIIRNHCSNGNDMNLMFDINLDPFWETHYSFQTAAKMRKTSFSNELQPRILINAVIPFRFALADIKSDYIEKENCKKLLKSISSENNTVIRSWDKIIGMNRNAFYSQALIEQQNEFCLRKKCLFCSIGRNLLSE